MMAKTALVTGASSGIGKAIAQELQAAGFQVYAAARRVERMTDLEQIGIIPIALDLTKEDSIAACVDTILSKEKSIDVLINNAGYGSYGAIEDVPLEEARRQFDVNLFGMARLIQIVTPSMRENHDGKIVNISSMGGKIWTKFGNIRWDRSLFSSDFCSLLQSKCSCVSETSGTIQALDWCVIISSCRNGYRSQRRNTVGQFEVGATGNSYWNRVCLSRGIDSQSDQRADFALVRNNKTPHAESNLCRLYENSHCHRNEKSACIFQSRCTDSIHQPQ